jgi:hypothetical protein
MRRSGGDAIAVGRLARPGPHRRRRGVGRLLALTAATGLGLASPASGQVFLASRPHPPFSIGPLFILASVTPELAPVTVRVSWGLTLDRRARPDDVRQPLYLLWPAEVADGTVGGIARPGLRRFVEDRGFAVVSEGRLLLRSRGRDQLGTADEGALIPEAASFVTFYKRGTNAAQAGVGTFVEIPWTPALVDPVSLTSLTMPVKDLIGPKPATWFEELFWGRRYLLTVGAGSAGSVALYSMYLEQRDRVVPFARDFSLVLANFADADHLRIEEVSPPSATRRPSRVRAGSETVSLPLNGSEGGVAQVLKVQFAYYSGRIAWRPVLISLLFLVLGNLMGAFMFTQEVARFLRRRLHLGRGDAVRSAVSAGPGPDTIERIVPGTTTRAEVRALCGPPDEEQEHIASTARRTLVYRDTRLVPQRRFRLGPIATVSHWVEERREVEIACDADRVTSVQTRVTRARR